MDEINQQVAERLRRLRKVENLSLEELASRSGVSRATLSQIETLKTNPTIAVLWKISQGLGVSFAELLGSDSASGVRLSRFADARYLYSKNREFRSRPLLANVPGHRVEHYELWLEAGAVEAAEPHPAGTVEQVFVTRGRLRLEIGTEAYELEPGDALLFPADVPHRYLSQGEEAFSGFTLILYAA